MKVRELIAELQQQHPEAEARSIGVGENSRPVNGVDGDNMFVYLYSPEAHQHDYPDEWDYTFSPAGSKTCRTCGHTIHD
jgi:hypothetical protein